MHVRVERAQMGKWAHVQRRGRVVGARTPVHRCMWACERAAGKHLLVMLKLLLGRGGSRLGTWWDILGLCHWPACPLPLCVPTSSSLRTRTRSTLQRLQLGAAQRSLRSSRRQAAGREHLKVHNSGPGRLASHAPALGPAARLHSAQHMRSSA